MNLDPEVVWKKLNEWNEVTQFALILQKEGFLSGLNDLSPTKKLQSYGFSEKEIEKIQKLSGI